MLKTTNIDADLLLYELGSVTTDEGHPLPWSLTKNRVDAKINKILESSGGDVCKLFLTGDGNFRIKEATILPYKGQRQSPKPHWHAKIKEYLLTTKNWDTVLCEGMEADDMLSIMQTKDTILASRDKDLDMVPGTHYSWGTSQSKEKGVYEVTEEEGIWWFFRQLLTGDMTDNIKGLYRIGPSHAKKALDGLSGALKLYTVAQKMYEDRFGSYWKMFLHENARLLWMKRTEDDDVRVWLEELEDERQRDQGDRQLY